MAAGGGQSRVVTEPQRERGLMGVINTLTGIVFLPQYPF
jgi:hypothetical protein